MIIVESGRWWRFDCIHVDDHDNDHDHTKRDLKLETCNLPLISRKTSTAIGKSGSTSPDSLSIKPWTNSGRLAGKMAKWSPGLYCSSLFVSFLSRTKIVERLKWRKEQRVAMACLRHSLTPFSSILKEREASKWLRKCLEMNSVLYNHYCPTSSGIFDYKTNDYIHQHLMVWLLMFIYIKGLLLNIYFNWPWIGGLQVFHR